LGTENGTVTFNSLDGICDMHSKWSFIILLFIRPEVLKGLYGLGLRVNLLVLHYTGNTIPLPEKIFDRYSTTSNLPQSYIQYRSSLHWQKIPYSREKRFWKRHVIAYYCQPINFFWNCSLAFNHMTTITCIGCEAYIHDVLNDDSGSVIAMVPHCDLMSGNWSEPNHCWIGGPGIQLTGTIKSARVWW
jgi:hypothetical protein